MSKVEPPSDLLRSEKKLFRQHVEKLEKSGVDASLRADLIADFCRSETRLHALREAEKHAETGSKLAANRAVTTASAERRRLFEAVYRGASTAIRTKAQRVEKAIATSGGAVDLQDGREAWRDLIHWRARGKAKPADYSGENARLKAKYGSPDFAALLFAFEEERQGWRALMAASHNNPSSSAIAALRAQMPGGRFTTDWLAPAAYRSAPAEA